MTTGAATTTGGAPVSASGATDWPWAEPQGTMSSHRLRRKKQTICLFIVPTRFPPLPDSGLIPHHACPAASERIVGHDEEKANGNSAPITSYYEIITEAARGRGLRHYANPLTT